MFFRRCAHQLGANHIEQVIDLTLLRQLDASVDSCHSFPGLTALDVNAEAPADHVRGLDRFCSSRR